MTQDLARRRALIQSTDETRKEERIEALMETMKTAVGGDCFEQRLAARDLADLGIDVTRGGNRAVA